jgi:hypothetical protein
LVTNIVALLVPVLRRLIGFGRQPCKSIKPFPN